MITVGSSPPRSLGLTPSDEAWACDAQARANQTSALGLQVKVMWSCDVRAAWAQVAIGCALGEIVWMTWSPWFVKICGGWDGEEVMSVYHSLGDAAAELFDLWVDVAKEGVAGPSSE